MTKTQNITINVFNFGKNMFYMPSSNNNDHPDDSDSDGDMMMKKKMMMRRYSKELMDMTIIQYRIMAELETIRLTEY